MPFALFRRQSLCEYVSFVSFSLVNTITQLHMLSILYFDVFVFNPIFDAVILLGRFFLDILKSFCSCVSAVFMVKALKQCLKSFFQFLVIPILLMGSLFNFNKLFKFLHTFTTNIILSVPAKSKHQPEPSACSHEKAI